MSVGSKTPDNFYYYANVAVAFGEGPGIITRIWADSKLIYSVYAGDQGDFPVGDYPVWDPTIPYSPNNIVAYQAQVFQCVTANTGIAPSSILPDSGTVYWELASNYQPWQSGIAYAQGQTVTYLGNLYVASVNNPGGPPGSGKWESIQQYYGVPAFYAGDENQVPDPLIQASEGAIYTPAFRGLIYFVWENFPLLNFGNRIPNFRAEVQYIRVNNVL